MTREPKLFKVAHFPGPFCEKRVWSPSLASALNNDFNAQRKIQAVKQNKFVARLVLRYHGVCLPVMARRVQ